MHGCIVDEMFEIPIQEVIKIKQKRDWCNDQLNNLFYRYMDNDFEEKYNIDSTNVDNFIDEANAPE